MALPRLAWAAALAAFLASPAAARSLILCKSPGQHDVVVSVQDRSFRGQVLNCIAGDFIADMTPCARPGGFGLSAPTGSADLVALVSRWQEYGTHDGGIAGHWITASEMGFAGGFNTRDKGFVEHWSFVASRLTGKAVLTVKDKPPLTYSCAKAAQRF